MDSRFGVVAVGKAIAEAVPDEVLGCECFSELEVLVPFTLCAGDVDAMLGASEDFVFGVEDFESELSVAGVRGVVGNGHMQHSGGIRCACGSSGCLKRFEHQHGR